MAGAISRSVSVRVDPRTYDRVRRLAQEHDLSITHVIAQAVEEAERRAFWRAHRESFERLRADPDAWAAYRAESQELEGTLGDGLEPDEDWSWLKAAADAGQLDAEQMAKSA